MRWILLWTLLFGCGPAPSTGPGDRPLSPDELLPRPRHEDMARFYGAGDAQDEPEGERPHGEERPVRVVLQLPASVERGTIALMGVRADELDGGWVRGRTRPGFFWVSEAVDFNAPIAVTAPLLTGLSYLAIVNQGRDSLPGPGDLVGGPVVLAEGAPASEPLEIAIDRPFEEATGRPGADPAHRRAGDPARRRHRAPLWSLRVHTEPAVPAGARVVLVSHRAGVQGGGVGLWSWRSPALPGAFPAALMAPLPDDGGELLGFLDLDGDGAPGAGDRYLERLPERRQGTEGELDLRFAAAEGGEVVDELRELLAAAESAEARAREAKGQERALVLRARKPAPVPTGVVLVAHWSDGDGSQPPTLWSSERMALGWPLRLSAPLPRGGDVVIGIDLDKDGALGPGDLASPRMRRFVPPPEGRPLEVELLLQ